MVKAIPNEEEMESSDSSIEFEAYEEEVEDTTCEANLRKNEGERMEIEVELPKGD